MEVKKLHENNELEKRAKHHDSKKKGLSFHCTLNPDAGDVEHNVSMFNHMNTPNGGPSTNPCGPMAEGVNKNVEMFDLHYDDLEVTIVTRPRRPSSYYFEYDRDEAQTVDEKVEYDYSVPKSDIVDFIFENMTENDYPEIDTASESDIVAFINTNFDTLYDKYESMILDHYRDSAREDAEWRMNESLSVSQLAEATCGTEKFVRSLGEDVHGLFLSKNIDENVSNELVRLEALYERYSKAQDESHMAVITERVKSALHSCADNKDFFLTEEFDEYIIMAVHNDGKKQYYNVSAVPHWVDKGKDATIFDDMDEARSVWFKIDKKPFKRVFIPNYDYEKMNEAVDADALYAQDLASDRIQDLLDFGMKGYFSRFIKPNVYRVYNRNKQTSVIVKFDINDTDNRFSFTVDGKHYTAQTENDAAKIIQSEADKKYSNSFDLAVEGLSDRIRRDELDYDDSIDAWTASENDTQVQFQDREQQTHEFRTRTNAWGRSYVDGQYNKQPKVASHTWGRVWKDGQLVKQAEGPKYQVRAEIAKYLDAEDKLDEAKIPDNWKQYRGAWMYPVYDGWEANLDGLHYEAETEDDLRLKIDSAVRGGFTRDNKLAQLHREADKLPPYGGMLDEDVEEGWSPDLIDCPACGDVSFDSRRGKCTRCAYRESLITEDEDDGRNVGVSFDVNAPSSMSETEIEDVIRKALAPTDLFINSYMEIHTLDESLDEGLTGYKITIIKNDETFDDYAFAYEEENAIQQMINKYGKDIKVTNVQVRKKVNEASYGGSFDIADDQYFTRDDLVECAEKVVEHLNETFDDTFEISNVEMNGNIFLIEVEGNDLGWYMEKCRIDMRKIRIPADLTNKYALEFASKFIATIKDYNDL